MADWKPPPFGTPTWLAIPATDVSRGKAIARMQNFVLDYSYREMMLHVEKTIRLAHSPRVKGS